jgi:hypothetical protein
VSDLREYKSSQWWYKELENIWCGSVGSGITHDMKRAAKVAINMVKELEAFKWHTVKISQPKGHENDAAPQGLIDRVREILARHGLDANKFMADTPSMRKPTIPHLAERKLWLAQREAGTNEVWQAKYPISGTWKDIPVNEEPKWDEGAEYRVKPKTVKRYMAMLRYKNNPTFSCVLSSCEELSAYARAHGSNIIGDIVEREVPIE